MFKKQTNFQGPAGPTLFPMAFLSLPLEGTGDRESQPGSAPVAHLHLWGYLRRAPKRQIVSLLNLVFRLEAARWRVVN